jgi:hypothetical protein
MTGAGPAGGPRRLDPGYSITRVRPGVVALAGEFIRAVAASRCLSGAGR